MLAPAAPAPNFSDDRYLKLYVDMDDAMPRISPHATGTPAALIQAKSDLDAVACWLKSCGQSVHTFNSYRREAERFLLWMQYGMLGSTPKQLAYIQLEDIYAYQAFCQQPPQDWCSTRRYPRTHPQWRPFSYALSLNSIKLSQTILSGLFSWLLHAQYIQANPFKLTKKNARSQNQQERYIPEAMWRVVVDVIRQGLAQAPDDKLMIRHDWLMCLFYLTGIRISEALHNKMSNITQEQHGGQTLYWLNVVGKGDKLRKIPFHPECLAAMQRYRESLGLPASVIYQENISLVTKYSVGKGAQAPTRAGLHGWIKEMFKFVHDKIAAGADLPEQVDPAYALDILSKASAHWIRHTTWTHMANQSIDIRFIRDNAGHSSIATTNGYLHTENVQRHHASMVHGLGIIDDS